MTNPPKRTEANDWRNSVRHDGQDAGYSERYYQFVHGQSFAKRKLVDAAVGFVFLVVITVAFVTGYFREALLVMFGVGVAAIPVWILRSVLKRRKQDRLYKEAVDRKNGMDRRFERHGSGRKRVKNA